jgi:hypothetical protein
VGVRGRPFSGGLRGIFCTLVSVRYFFFARVTY